MSDLHEQAVTVKPITSAILVLDSFDRGTGQPVNNFTLQPGAILSSGYFSRIVPVVLHFPYAIPNVNPKNNTLTISNGATNTIITIPEGFYTIAELATQLQTSLNASGFGGVFAVSVDVKTLYYTVTNTLIPFKIINTPGKSNDLVYMAGFETNNTLSLTQVGTYNNLQYTTFIDIRSNKLTKFQKVSDVSSNLTATTLLYRVYISWQTLNIRNNDNMFWTRTATIAFETTNPKHIRWIPSGEFLSDVDISLYDDNEELLYIPAGHPDFQISLYLSET